MTFADDLVALANVGGGVLIIGVGTDNADRAASLHEDPLMVIEQQAVQADHTTRAWCSLGGRGQLVYRRVRADAGLRHHGGEVRIGPAIWLYRMGGGGYECGIAAGP